MSDATGMMGLVGQKRQKMVIEDKEFEYTTVWQFPMLRAVIIWSALSISHLWWAWVYYHYYSNSYIDLVSLVLNVLIWG